MNDILVYTTIFGGRDVVKAPEGVGFDWKVITDQEGLEAPGTTVTPLPIAGSPRRSSRLFKLMPQLFFPGYKRWVWIDGNITLRKDVDAAFLGALQGPLGVLKHIRKCIYEEADICLNHKNDAAETIRAHVEGYRKEGFPINFGLAATGVLVRDNTKEIQAFNRLWWKELSTKSLRDQLSFNYCAWKLGILVNYIAQYSESGIPPTWFHIGNHVK